MPVMTPKEIAVEVAKNVGILTDPIMRKEWINSPAFKIEEHVESKQTKKTD